MVEQRLQQELKKFLPRTPISLRFRQSGIDLDPNVLTPVLGLPLASPARQREWLEARRLEVQVRHDLVELGVEQHATFTSVSHTRVGDQSWVIVVGSSVRLGVDLESSSRRVHPDIAERLISQSERDLSLSVLAFWVIKEAAFKSNPKNQGTVLSQYRVTAWDLASGLGNVSFPAGVECREEGSLLSKACQFKLVQIGPWWVAFASCFD